MRIFILPVVFFLMEIVAWASHRYLMHGPLWIWHASHHRPRRGPFEANDLFGVFFAFVSMALIARGVKGRPELAYAGWGMALYGVAYFLLHDVLTHRRFGLSIPPRGTYLRAVLRSHRIHHARHTKENGVSFGFLMPLPKSRVKATLNK